MRLTYGLERTAKAIVFVPGFYPWFYLVKMFKLVMAKLA